MRLERFASHDREPAPHWRTPEVRRIDARALASPNRLQPLLDDYRDHGFTLFELDAELAPGAASLSRLAQVLHLGEPFVPPLYARAGSEFYEKSGFNLVMGDPAEMETRHPAFASRGPLEFHTDGTLQAIGEIPTSLLFCLEQAAAGGDTLLFDAAGAFSEIARRDSRLAQALLDERALWRHATVGGSDDASVGPVFLVRGERVLARYCVTPRERWAVDEVPSLAEARQALAELSHPDSPWCKKLRPLAGQGILFANDRLSHARTAYTDAPGRPRRMLRALFRERPRLG